MKFYHFFIVTNIKTTMTTIKTAKFECHICANGYAGFLHMHSLEFLQYFQLYLTFPLLYMKPKQLDFPIATQLRFKYRTVCNILLVMPETFCNGTELGNLSNIFTTLVPEKLHHPHLMDFPSIFLRLVYFNPL